MGNNNPQGGNKKTFRFNLYWMYALIALSLIGVYYMNDGSSSKEVTWSEFEQIARDGGIKHIAEITAFFILDLRTETRFFFPLAYFLIECGCIGYIYV